MSDYLLGTSDHELDRLTFQQSVWRNETAAFLDALQLGTKERVLDLGAGPGLVTAELRRIVGPEGEVVAIDQSERWTGHIEAVAEGQGWKNVRTLCASLQALESSQVNPKGRLADAALMRWVLSFLPDPGGLLGHLATLVRPGGLLGVMDYNHLGVSLFPRRRGFEAVIDAIRRAYARVGGDSFVMGSIHRHFRRAGLEPVHLQNHVLAGGPGTPVFEWADRFFPFHVPRLVEGGDLSPADAKLFGREWAETKRDPDALFFSPIVVSAIGQRPLP